MTFACCNFAVAMPAYIFLLSFPHHLAISGKEGERFSQEVKIRIELFLPQQIEWQSKHDHSHLILMASLAHTTVMRKTLPTFIHLTDTDVH